MKVLLLSSLLIPLAIAATSLAPSSASHETKGESVIEDPTLKSACTEMPGFISRKWMMEEIRFLQNNQAFYYKRGDRSESNMNFDNDWLVFNCDGKGLYHQGDGIDYNMEWQLVEGKNITLRYTISKFRDKSDLIVTLEDIKLDDNKVSYTEYYTHKNKTHSLGVVKRIADDITESSVIPNYNSKP